MSYARCSPLRLSWANDRTDRELAAEEDGGLGHDQVGPEIGTSGSEVRKHQLRMLGISQRSQRRRNRRACLVVPDLKVHGLGGADAEQNEQHFHMADPLRQRGVDAGAPLLDRRKMEGGCVGDRLNVLSGGKVTIVSGNGWMLAHIQTRNRLREGGVIDIGVLRAAAVARPETGVHSELHEVGESSLVLLGTCRLTAGQRAKPIQIDWLRALGSQVRVDEREVSELILSIVVDILRHVLIQVFQGLGVGGIPTAAWDFAVLDAS